ALARWRAAVRAAAKQARRGRVPHVTDPVSTRELVDVVAGADRALVLDGGADVTLPEVTL
ncbi:16S rRNA (uracil(1498)-N(3))-methyltransferase, partial [Saccharomonospora iraqiensis]|uniref:16S rRNA (uracil(1498)-N(3))-methyltransferase n=1 Tax=Saccharomonospora iraqiensis TaxID=52698 RepID=UPI000594DF83